MFCDLSLDENGHLLQGDPSVPGRIRELFWTEWYEDTEGCLYIVDELSDEWVHGPDNEMADKIAAELEGGAAPWELANLFEELTYVDYVLRRFDEETGFYHA